MTPSPLLCKNGGMAKPSVLVVQHVEWERPGRILESLQDCGLGVDIVNVVDRKKPDLPAPDDLAGLVLMGGPMGAADYDRHPGLKAETKLVKAALAANLPLLGVCLGHQIIARALGAAVTRARQPEYGISPVRWVGDDDDIAMWSKSTDVLQWHADEVSLPAGAKLLARSRRTRVQAFRAGSALGLQFHLEVTLPLFDEWMDQPEMVADMNRSKLEEIREGLVETMPQMQPLADSIFSAFAARCLTFAGQAG